MALSKRVAAQREADERHIKALAHPLRQRILEVLNRRVASPRELAEELGEKLGDVGYHVRMLRAYGAIELVRTEQRRGAIKHFYRATTRAMLDDEQWARLPQSARNAFTGNVLEMSWQHATNAAANGGFEADGARYAAERLELDERGYEQLVKVLGETLDKALEIQARVAGRRADTGSGAAEVTTELVILHFLPEGERGR